MSSKLERNLAGKARSGHFVITSKLGVSPLKLKVIPAFQSGACSSVAIAVVVVSFDIARCGKLTL